MGKYYVVDSGYASQTGYLIPFRGERYDLPDYRENRRKPTTANELFNYRHSSLRNVIERTFGVLKNKFKLLRQMNGYSLQDQAHIVLACCGLHNFIRDEHIADEDLMRLSDDLAEVDPDELNPVHKDYVPSVSQIS
ncbi:uncharacterized protein LOC122638708 [Telopea speciosissima]|uniref:uncharacterized protein LOC122638708 n=1 Tax=Telopea speciosissima TaxID=54955 RepID=UPI001CC6B0A8|nr:uncharacterized protein LOC122638708 [Telopea speciosissima]